jgi:hypothetical protein
MLFYNLECHYFSIPFPRNKRGKRKEELGGKGGGGIGMESNDTLNCIKA